VDDAIPQGSPDGSQTGHESTSIQARGLIIGAAVLVATVIVCQILLGVWMGEFHREEERAEVAFPTRNEIDVGHFPQPRLQENPKIDMMDVRREEQARVNSYGWIDQKAGVARIPIDRAMDIIAQKGLPRVAAPPPTAGAPPNTTIPPAGKREEAGPGENQPAPPKKDDRTGPESKQGGKS
jgi:hypothetical protein